MLIVMAGLPGTGKSTLARAIAPALAAVILDKDAVRASLFPPECIEYSTEQDDFCVDVMLQTAGFLLRRKPQQRIILDGRTFTRSYQVDRVMQAAAAMGTPVRWIECVCSEETALRRLAAQQDTGGHPAGNRSPELYQALKQGAEPLAVLHATVNTEQTLEVCVEAALRTILT